jgi:hypothetical protein
VPAICKATRFPFTHRDFPLHCADFHTHFHRLIQSSSRKSHIAMAPVRNFISLFERASSSCVCYIEFPTFARARRNTAIAITCTIVPVSHLLSSPRHPFLKASVAKGQSCGLQLRLLNGW